MIGKAGVRSINGGAGREGPWLDDASTSQLNWFSVIQNRRLGECVGSTRIFRILNGNEGKAKRFISSSAQILKCI